MVSATKVEDEYLFLSKSTHLDQSEGVKTHLYHLGAEHGNDDLKSTACPEQGPSLLDTILLSQWDNFAWKGHLDYDVTACQLKVIEGGINFVGQLNNKWNSFSLKEYDKIFESFRCLKANSMKSYEGLLLCIAQGENDRPEVAPSASPPKDGLLLIANLEYELQKEISNIMIQNYVCSLQREFEMKLWEHQNCISTLNRNWKEKVSEIAVLQDELRCVLNAVVSSESGIHPHQSHSSLEDRIIVKMKDDNEPPVTEKATDTSNVMLDIPDFSLLKHMQSEEITNFLKSEWLKLRRQHESELHQKTEELFRVKREYAKAKASLPLKKERELELIKSKLLQTISKLGEITMRKEDSCFDCKENDMMCRLKDRIGMLLHENNCLRGLLADKRKEVKHLCLQVPDAKNQVAQHSLSEAKLLNNFEKVRAELEDLRIERHLNNLLDSSIFREVFDDYENQIYDMNQEGSFLKELLNEKEDQLSIIYEDRQKLKYENNQLVSIAGSIIQHHDQFNLANDELLMFKEKVCEQELLILETKSEYNSMKRCLYEAMQQIQVCKQEVLELTENLTSISIALEEAKEQNASLEATIQEMKKTPAQSIGSYRGQTGESDLAIMEKLSKAYSDFESRLAETMKRNETRLTSIIGQFNPLVQQVAALRKKEFWYKQIIEIKCSNLRKAEAEVDVLGDEVDTLLSIMGKIYIALDHYSPVLKHYPGVTEILMLVQKVLKGENI